MPDTHQKGMLVSAGVLNATVARLGTHPPPGVSYRYTQRARWYGPRSMRYDAGVVSFSTGVPYRCRFRMHAMPDYDWLTDEGTHSEI
jgi:hypothetical protein